MVVNRVDDHQVVDLTEDAARGVEDMAAANDRVAVEDMVAVDGTVEVLVRIAHYLLMQKCTFTVHHVCVCVQSYESGLLLMLEGWQAVQEADWEGRDLSGLSDLQHSMAQQLERHGCPLRL